LFRSMVVMFEARATGESPHEVLLRRYGDAADFELISGFLDAGLKMRETQP
jgi:hypothetical protein